MMWLCCGYDVVLMWLYVYVSDEVDAAVEAEIAELPFTLDDVKSIDEVK